jgi:hypothetical protein
MPSIRSKDPRNDLPAHLKPSGMRYVGSSAQCSSTLTGTPTQVVWLVMRMSRKINADMVFACADKQSDPLPAFLASRVKVATAGRPRMWLCHSDCNPCKGPVEDSACSEIAFYGPTERCWKSSCALHHYDMYAMPRICELDDDAAISVKAKECVDKGTTVKLVSPYSGT